MQKWQQPPSIFCVSNIFQSGHRAVTHHGGQAQAEQTHGGCHGVDVGSACYGMLLESCRHLVVVAVPTKRLGIDVIFWERLVMTWGDWPSLKDCIISANLGSCVIFFSSRLSGGVDTQSKIVHLLGVVGVEVVGSIVVMGMMRGLEHPEEGWSERNPWDEPSP